MVKSLSKNAGPWAWIQRLHSVGQTILSLVAISGTPISTGPLDIMGPLKCFHDNYGTQPEAPQRGEAGYDTFLNDDILEEIGTTFAELLATNPKGEKMDQLIVDFGRRYQPSYQFSNLALFSPRSQVFLVLFSQTKLNLSIRTTEGSCLVFILESWFTPICGNIEPEAGQQ